MARKMPARDVIVKLIVGAGQASPSPPVGPALGSKGVKSMDFCKVRDALATQRSLADDDRQEFNARTAHLNPGVPIPARVIVRPDRSFSFDIRTPTTAWLLLQAAGVKEVKGKLKGAKNPGTDSIGTVSLKHVYEIAKIKQTESRLTGLSLEGLCKSVISQAKSMGVEVVP